VSWLYAFLGFAVLIILHEFGHFAAAKAVGMRVERFALFFPPLLFKVRRGETEYGIGAIPLGGYVRITGMNPHEEIPPEVEHRAYFRQPVWKRIVVISAGPAMNFLIAFVLLWAIYLSVGTGTQTRQIGKLEKGYPAASVLRPGDRLVAVDGKRGAIDEIPGLISTHKCAGTPQEGCRATTPVALTVVRNGHLRTVELTPIYDPAAGRTRVGFAFRVIKHDQTAWGAVKVAGDDFWRITKLTVALPARLFNSEKRKEIGSVVGGYEATRQSFSFDTTQAFYVLAIISLSLAIINLFPFLPLDGGHIFWALAEKVRGRRIPVEVMERASVIGFMLIIFLFFIGFTNDLSRLQNGGFRPR
jgi:regulator of sigma E protease